MYQVYLIDDEPWVLIGLERLISWEKIWILCSWKINI